jgi:hypothetical protein
VHCAHALTVAMQTACAGPSVKSAQKFTACDSDRFEWLRPSGSSILTADVTIAIPISARSSAALSRRMFIAATARQATPARATAAT